MPCQDCFQTQKELNQQFAIVQQQAKELAVKLNCNVFIFQTAEGWQYMAEAPARQNGIQPTGGIVSGLVAAA
jgi:hypothetical protein